MTIEEDMVKLFEKMADLRAQLKAEQSIDDECDECFMRGICEKEKESELSILRDKDIVKTRLDEYCPLKEIVRSNIRKHVWQLADVVDKYQMYYGKESVK